MCSNFTSQKLYTLLFCISLFALPNISCDSESNSAINIFRGYVFDASYAVGENHPIGSATVTVEDNIIQTDQTGYFEFSAIEDSDPLVTITAPGYHEYEEYSSRMVEGAFYLIPEGYYQDFQTLTWIRTSSNPQNWHRKWNQQTEFYIVKNGASDDQVSALIQLLMTDDYSKLTGGLFHSNSNPTVLQSDPEWRISERNGQTKIYFQDGIMMGGIAHSTSDQAGIIYYAEVGYNTNQEIEEHIVWHEIAHTVTAGGHINYRPGITSEVSGGGITENDIKVFNCIYNSPPKRTN